MTGKADYTDEEWKLLREAPTSAGMLVIQADRGGVFRENFSMAKAYTDARRDHGASQLLDDLASEKPEVDRTRVESAEELRANLLQHIRDAVTLVNEKAREAWLPEKGFGWPTRVVTAQRMDDPREIVTIGFSDIGAERAEALLAGVGLESSGAKVSEDAEEPVDEHIGEVAEEQLARRDRISEVIEPEMTRAFYVQLAEDDLT